MQKCVKYFQKYRGSGEERRFFSFFPKHPFCSFLCCEPENISQIDAWKMKTAVLAQK